MASMLCYLTLLLCAVCLNEACSCEQVHPQTGFCKAEFAVRAKVLKTRTAKDMKVYKLKILQTFKGGAEIDRIAKMKRKGKIVKLTSEYSRKIVYCTLTGLNRGQTYLLTGGIDASKKVLTANACHWHALWRDLTAEQHHGLSEGIYGENCDCKIEPFCWGDSCDDKIDGCNGNEHDYDLMSCRAKYSLCVKSGQQCYWVSGNKLCMGI